MGRVSLGYLAEQESGIIHSHEGRSLMGGRDCLIWKTLSQWVGQRRQDPLRTGDITRFGGNISKRCERYRVGYMGGEERFEGRRNK